MTGVLGDGEWGAEAPSGTLSGQAGTPEGANRSTGRHPVADDVAPGRKEPPVSNHDLHWIANYIWGIADDVLRDLYVRGKYRDVILPMTVLRRLDAVLEGSYIPKCRQLESFNVTCRAKRPILLSSAP